MMRSGFVQVIAVLLCGALLYGASTFAPSINRGRAALNMLASEKPEVVARMREILAGHPEAKPSIAND